MHNARYQLLRRCVRFVSVAAVVGAVAGCTVAESTPGLPVHGLEPLPSPAGEGSGEPYLSVTDYGVALSWLERVAGRRHALKMSLWDAGAWSAPVTLATQDDFFVNWADFPSVAQVGPGMLAAHWLQRGGTGTYDYGVRVVHSLDGGSTWTEPWTPHEDDTPTEHGFVSLFPLLDGGWGLVWLDGRAFHAVDGSEPTREMALRFRRVGRDGAPDEEVVLDGRICECCQTSAALTSRGPLVVYRDRTVDEIRDIYVTRLVDGAWTEGRAVHDDGWHIGGCPVNGPAVSARGDAVAVGWFTGAGDQPRVRVAFSADAGATFSAPVQVDDGNPGGRVDVTVLEDGSALVSWLERLEDGVAEVRARRVWPTGQSGPPVTVTRSSDARASGFPRMVRDRDGSVVFAWTDVSGDASWVRVARAEVAEVPVR